MRTEAVLGFASATSSKKATGHEENVTTFGRVEKCCSAFFGEPLNIDICNGCLVTGGQAGSVHRYHRLEAHEWYVPEQQGAAARSATEKEQVVE